MAQIMGGSNARLQAGFALWTRASTSSPTLHRQLQALRPICAPLHYRSRAVHPGVSMRAMQALAANPTVPSWLTSASGQHRGARFGQALVSGQRLHHAQAPWRATRTLRATRNRERAFSGSERKFPAPAARPSGASLRCAAKLRSDPKNHSSAPSPVPGPGPES